MMKNKIPSEGLRLGRDSGSILCDTLKKVAFSDSLGGVTYISMSAYMFHRQIFFLIYHVYWPQDGYERLLFLIFVCLPIIGAVSYIIQRSYDSILNAIKK